MLKIILRTLIIYILLLTVMRLMGKRQLGELEPSEIITTFLFSEIATTPITNPESNIWHAILPIIIIASLEILLSFSVLKIPLLKKILTGRPSVIIQRGKINKEEMKRARLTLDELISGIRQGGIFNISEVDYAILEENGRLTVVPKCEDGIYKLGVSLKRAASGIGTVSFIDPETGIFGGLGHGVCDSDSGNLVRDPISGKSVVVADVSAMSSALPSEIVRAVKRRDASALAGLSPDNAKNLRFVPSRTATGGGMLYALLPERITVSLAGGKPYEVDALVAPIQLGASASGFDALIPPELLV